MRFALSLQEQQFFKTHHYIEFEGFFPKDVLAKANHAVKTFSPDLFIKGRDAWRHISSIKTISLSSRLAETASLLFDSKTVRIGYDQILTSQLELPPLWKKGAALSKTSCIRPLLGGVILRLNEISPPLPPLLPQHEGNLVFFGPNFVFPWSAISEQRGQNFLLVTFLPEQGQYCLSESDPTTHALKKLGYAFGDALNFETHPILYKKRSL